MAYEGTKAYYDKQAELAKQNADIAYTTAMGELARRYASANRKLESNLEARGILRSGEGNVARTELTAEEEANKAAAESAKTQAYNEADITLASQLAALMAQSGGGGGGGGGSTGSGGGTGTTPATTTTPTTSRPIVAYQSPTVSFAGPYGTMTKPSAPAQPSAAYQTPTVSSTGLYGAMTPDLSGVDWAALGRLMQANTPQTQVAKPATPPKPPTPVKPPVVLPTANKPVGGGKIANLQSRMR